MKSLQFSAAVLLLGIGALAWPAIGQNAEHQAATPSNPPAVADPHAGHAMPMPTAPAASSGAPEHAEHGTAEAATAADLPVGDAPSPPQISLGAADTIYGATAMSEARAVLASEHGGEPQWKLMADKAEYRGGPDGAAFGWEAEAWFGGDVERLVLKSEGAGTTRHGIEEGEWQALYSRAVAPYTDLQLGLRRDFGDHVATYAVLGVETILPYWLKADAALFLSSNADAFARLEGRFDIALTQQLMLQPDLELNFSAQAVPASMTGSGLTDITAGLRLRYDIIRQFAPYIGVEYERMTGGTSGLRRRVGLPVESTSLVVGVRAFL